MGGAGAETHEAGAVARIAAAQPSEIQTLGLHLLLGPIAREVFGNMIRNLQERRIVMIHAVAAAE